MEMLLVIVIIASLATMIVPMVDRSREDAQQTVARASMKTVSEAISGYLGDMKNVPGFRSVDLRMHDLFSPSSYPDYDARDKSGAVRGWRGPYLRTAHSFGPPEDLKLADPWGNPYVIQTPSGGAFERSAGDAKRFRYSRLVSAGPDGIFTTRTEDRLADDRGDDPVLFLNRADMHEDEEP